MSDLHQQSSIPGICLCAREIKRGREFQPLHQCARSRPTGGVSNWDMQSISVQICCRRARYLGAPGSLVLVAVIDELSASQETPCPWKLSRTPPRGQWQSWYSHWRSLHPCNLSKLPKLKVERSWKKGRTANGESFEGHTWAGGSTEGDSFTVV